MTESITVSPAVMTDIKYIDDLQRKNAEELSFYPRVVFEREVENQRILLAKINAEPAGYLYHGAFNPVVKIHQACIQYDVRGYLYGAALIRFFKDLVDSMSCLSIVLRCGSDIAANGFWEAMGFYCQSVTPGGVRRMRDINSWRLDLQPALFSPSVDPSTKEQDASIWRKREHSAQSQFIRGRRIAEYRRAVSNE